jgi:hypothetical protein
MLHLKEEQDAASSYAWHLFASSKAYLSWTFSQLTGFSDSCDVKDVDQGICYQRSIS